MLVFRLHRRFGLSMLLFSVMDSPCMFFHNAGWSHNLHNSRKWKMSLFLLNRFVSATTMGTTFGFCFLLSARRTVRVDTPEHLHAHLHAHAHAHTRTHARTHTLALEVIAVVVLSQIMTRLDHHLNSAGGQTDRRPWVAFGSARATRTR